jgi:hypothetical protein
MKLVLNPVPATQGIAWLRQGWQVFRKAPLALSALWASYLVVWMVLSFLGTLGAILMLGTLPLLSLVYMLATHHVVQDRPVTLSVWLRPFKLTRNRVHAHLQLGLLYVIGTVAIMLLANWLDGGALQSLQEAMGEAGQSEASARAAEAAMRAASEDSAFFLGLSTRVVGATLLSVPFWHAPALVHWGGHGALKALFSSCVGVWANRSAFLSNGLMWAGVLVLGSLLVSLLMLLLGAPGLASFLVMPMALFVGTVFYCGLYFTFVDCFRFVTDAAPTPEPADQR